MKTLTQDAIALLKSLIETQSFSGEEHNTRDRIEAWFQDRDIPTQRIHNNIVVVNKYEDPSKPYILLNSHHDTVRPNKAYTKDPLKAIEEDGKLFGLGSNDAGGALVSLIAVFTHFYAHKDLNYNLVLAATGEEENSGPKGLKGILDQLPQIDFAIVGEPTLMQLAIAEKGLVVFDCYIHGTPSHAAHPNDDNPIQKVPEVVQWFNALEFDRKSEVLGDVKLTLTELHAGKQHNAVPEKVHLVIDVRVNDRYTNAEIAAIVEQAPCEVITRSLDLNSSSIAVDHPIVAAGIQLGRETYGSPTLSDQAALYCDSLKLGPGDSTRSHTADEYIYVHEIEEAIPLYIDMLNSIL